MLAHTLARQARQPSGLLGRLFGMGMGRMNQGVNDWVISLLDLQPEHAVLELGFGPGKALQAAERLVPKGRLCGVDMSSAMFDQAARRNRAAIQAGKMDLRLGEASHLPYPDLMFDRIFCVNVIYFWANPATELTEIFRVAKRGGRVAIYIGDRDQMATVSMTRTGLFKLYTPEEVQGLLESQGFAGCEIHRSSISQGPISRGSCVVGTIPVGM